MKPDIIIVCGPGAAGKSSTVSKIVELRDDCVELVSYTTRPMRKDEADGIDYHFVDEATFISKVNSGDMFEYTKYNNNYYGLSKTSFQDDVDKFKFVIVDGEGMRSIKETFANTRVRSLLMLPPSTKEMIVRMKAQGRTKEEIGYRLNRLNRESAVVNSGFDFVAINRDIEDCANLVVRMLDLP